MLRDPVKRYISEWKHLTQRGQWYSWLTCGGRRAIRREVPPCFRGQEISHFMTNYFLGLLGPRLMADPTHLKFFLNWPSICQYKRKIVQFRANLANSRSVGSVIRLVRLTFIRPRYSAGRDKIYGPVRSLIYAVLHRRFRTHNSVFLVHL